MNSSALHTPLPDEVQLALAYTPPNMRDALRTAFELDARLARIVAATNEPMLGQMRLAWWRDTLGTPVRDRPAGDAVLDAIGQHWAGHEAALVALVDGWECMLAEPPLPREGAQAFAMGRAVAVAGCAAMTGANAQEVTAVERSAMLWAIADAASHMEDGAERSTMLELAARFPERTRLQDPFRGIAVLGALARRALDAGGAPLMAGRGAAVVAMRAGLLGR